jgi:hypothetical protein
MLPWLPCSHPATPTRILSIDASASSGRDRHGENQLLFAKDPQMRRLAQEIITDQQSEIELMQMWLKRHQPGSQKSN